MSFLGNIIWVVFGGFLIFVQYIISGFLLCITIIGIPFGIQIFKLAILSLWPFGKEVENIPDASGCLSVVMNVIWFLYAGLWIALHHLLWALIFCITIVGIPFGVQHFKLAGLALFPFGKQIS